ncbi:MAG TPA: C40 family peptidase [Chitinophagaceae bacterium]|nr:C40 family peptidase [Chitinophagaceae bacterium]
MEYAVIAVPAAPVRRKARHQREMVSQLLFGETVRILKEKDRLWVKVCSLHDDYEGWLTRTLLKETTEKEAKRNSEFVTTGLINTIVVGNQVINVPLGSSLPFFSEGKGRLGDIDYSFNGNFIDRQQVQPNPEVVQLLTHQWLNAPYMWGGRTLFGVDCSGFVQVNFKMMGLNLPRDAWQQAQLGRTVNRLKDATCGDLAFFDDKEEIVHVGILLNSELIIHASGKVRIDTIDKKGIVNSDTGKRTHSLRSIKRHW